MTAVDPNGFRELPAHLPIRLDNNTCVYCGIALTEENRTKEHVVGRRFVPKGLLDGWWNLIVGACHGCNAIKADLEDDISAITLAPNAAGTLSTTHPVHRAEAERKGKRSISRKSRKPVGASAEKLKYALPMGRGGELQADFTAPPQIEQERLFHLARLQVRAFFYWLTYDELKKTGKHWHEGCYLVVYAIHSDWGNALLRGFSDLVKHWEPRFIGTGAEGFFRIAIRRHPTAGCFSWALEWNQNYRIAGFFGDREMAQAIVNTLPELKTTTLWKRGNDYIRMRPEVPLPDGDDVLFGFPS